MFEKRKLLEIKVNYLTFSDFSEIDIDTKSGREAYLQQINDLKNVENEAEILFNNMPDFRDDLLIIIYDLMEKSITLAQNYYDLEVEKIKNTTPVKYWNNKLEEFELSSIERRQNNKPYFKIFTKIREGMINCDKDDINAFIADMVSLDIASSNRFSNKIIKICDFNSSFQEYLLLENIFNIINKSSDQQEKSLLEKNTIHDFIKKGKQSQFKEILELLISKSIISPSDGESFDWFGITNYFADEEDLNHDNYASLSNKKLLLAFGSILKQRGYVELKTTDKNLSNALAILFNARIDPDYFGQIKRELTESLNSRINNPYISFFDFIPKSV